MLLLLLACAGSGDDTAKGSPDDSGTSPDTTLDPATVPLAGTCDMAVDFGGFEVTATDDATSVDGAVADGVVPSTVLEEIYAEGDCRVLRRDNPFCDPACDPGEACDFDGTCVPYPVNQDLGSVTISGMAAPVEMEAVFPGNTYYDTSLPNPGFSAGDLLTLNMPGGLYGPLTLHGVGIEPLTVSNTSWTIDAGTDLAIGWPAPTGDVVRSEIVVTIAIDQHGVSPSTLACTFADDGEGTVPGAVVTALVDAGVTGFPNGSITRRTADHADAGAGCLDFVVSAPRSVSVEVAGHTPCMSDEECPDGQTCDEDLQTCQ